MRSQNGNAYSLFRSNVCGLLDLFDLRRFAGTSAQIIQLRPADFALADNGDVRDFGGMHGERPLDADAVRKPPYRKCFADAAVLLCFTDGILPDLLLIVNLFLKNLKKSGDIFPRSFSHF